MLAKAKVSKGGKIAIPSACKKAKHLIFWMWMNCYLISRMVRSLFFQ